MSAGRSGWLSICRRAASSSGSWKKWLQLAPSEADRGLARTKTRMERSNCPIRSSRFRPAGDAPSRIALSRRRTSSRRTRLHPQSRVSDRSRASPRLASEPHTVLDNVGALSRLFNILCGVLFLEIVRRAGAASARIEQPLVAGHVSTWAQSPIDAPRPSPPLMLRSAACGSMPHRAFCEA